MWGKLIKWLENNTMACSFQKYFGIECPGCGFQSSLVALLKGNISESLVLYPALLPMLSFFGLLLLQLKFKFSWGAFVLKVLFLISFLLILGNFSQKLLLQN